MTTPQQKEHYEVLNLRQRVKEQREQIGRLQDTLFRTRRERDELRRELCAACASKTCTGCRWEGDKNGHRKNG